MGLGVTHWHFFKMNNGSFFSIVILKWEQIASCLSAPIF